MLLSALYNIFDFVATMISASGPEAGNESGLCRFQAFSLQIFPVADVLWKLAMTWDVFLVVFWQYEPEALRRLEKRYLAAITTITFIPAFVFLFVRNDTRGPLYGSVTVSTAAQKDALMGEVTSSLPRFGAPYLQNGCSTRSYSITHRYGTMPHDRKRQWANILPRLLIAMIFALYIIIVRELFRLRHEWLLTRDDCLVLSSAALPSNDSIIGAILNNTKTPDGINSTICLVPPYVANKRPAPLIRQHSAVSLRKFLPMPILFFVALLATWVTPTIDRIYAFRHPGQEPYGLMLAVAGLGSLRGFWNGVIFLTMQSKSRR
ncbi:putative cAMP receptor (Car4) [Aspergillus mulundensis]|uniref:Glucose receptor Git3 N-terminal domain-containing protein n=1 Tax=Aspergillus mulundensis TaxID=1810919 RepID=A0A3D8R455_9EURO|nr:hypothetical protein DSM5745_08471 [Aspergillus mulundensis]RDW68711.1 hypothetical protein DSM5745_08471 [Aspergillus mulundensis]